MPGTTLQVGTARTLAVELDFKSLGQESGTVRQWEVCTWKCAPQVFKVQDHPSRMSLLERRERRKVGQREEKRTREAGTKMQCSTW